MSFKRENSKGWRGGDLWEFSSLRIWGTIEGNFVGILKHEILEDIARMKVCDNFEGMFCETFWSMRISGDFRWKTCGTQS